MDSPLKEPRRKATAIPRLYKKLSFDSALPFSHEYQDDNLLNRSSSDPNTGRTPDQAGNKSKNLCRFTLNENLIQGKKPDDVEVANESDDDVHSDIFHMKHVTLESEKSETQEVTDKTEYIDDTDLTKGLERVTSADTTEQVSQKELSSNLTTPCDEIRPFQSSETQTSLSHTDEEHNTIRNRLIDIRKQNYLKQTLQEAYLTHVDKEKQQSLEQLRWNIINPLYKNIFLSSESRPGTPINSSVVSDVNVKGLTIKEESSEIDTDDDYREKQSPRLDQVKCSLYNMYNKDLPMSLSEECRHESLVNTFLEVFGQDSHIIEKIRNKTNRKFDDRFRKIRETYTKKEEKSNEVCVVQDSPGDITDYESCNKKLVQHFYKNDDGFSTVTQSSNPGSTSDRCQSPESQKQHSAISGKTCCCEMKHSQLNEVQKSITDVENGMRVMLANMQTKSNSDIAVELIKLRRLYEECLLCQRKATMQSKRLQNDVQNIYCALVKLLESQAATGPSLKYFLFPVLGVITYFVFANCELLKKIPVEYE